MPLLLSSTALVPHLSRRRQTHRAASALLPLPLLLSLRLHR
jgi:hypothetical protein